MGDGVGERPGDRQAHPRRGLGQPDRLGEREVLVAWGRCYVHRGPEPIGVGERRELPDQPLQTRREAGEELVEALRVLVDEEPGRALRRGTEPLAARGDKGTQPRQRVFIHQPWRVVALEGGQAAHQGPPVLPGREHGDQRAGDHQPQVGGRPVAHRLAAAQVGPGGGQPQHGLEIGVRCDPGDYRDPPVQLRVLGGEQRDRSPNRDPHQPDPPALRAPRGPAGHLHRRLHGGG